MLGIYNTSSPSKIDLSQGKKGGFAFIPGGKSGDFPLCPLYPSKLK
jgi:hypothetical protein